MRRINKKARGGSAWRERSSACLSVQRRLPCFMFPSVYACLRLNRTTYTVYRSISMLSKNSYEIHIFHPRTIPRSWMALCFGVLLYPIPRRNDLLPADEPDAFRLDACAISEIIIRPPPRLGELEAVPSCRKDHYSIAMLWSAAKGETETGTEPTIV